MILEALLLCGHFLLTTTLYLKAMFNHYGIIFFNDRNVQKECWKDSHRRLFRAVNLPNYLGSKEYQVAKKCFKIRDFLAHGKTQREATVVELPEDFDRHSIFNHMIALDSKPFREASNVLLQLFVETARKIELDIENNGFYPNQEHAEEKF